VPYGLAETGILLDMGAFCLQLQNLESIIVWEENKFKSSKNVDIVKWMYFVLIH